MKSNVGINLEREKLTVTKWGMHEWEDLLNALSSLRGTISVINCQTIIIKLSFRVLLLKNLTKKLRVRQNFVEEIFCLVDQWGKWNTITENVQIDHEAGTAKGLKLIGKRIFFPGNENRAILTLNKLDWTIPGVLQASTIVHCSEKERLLDRKYSFC